MPLSNYTENLKFILNEATKTGAEVIFTTTTPVPANYPPGSRTEKNVVAYNAAATRVASAYCVAVNDLHGAIVRACPRSYLQDGNCSRLQWPRGVHFVHAGRELCGKVVAKAVVAAMDRAKQWRSHRKPRYYDRRGNISLFSLPREGGGRERWCAAAARAGARARDSDGTGALT